MEHSRIVDLSVTVAADLPSAWPFHMPFSTRVWNYYADLDERQGRISSYGPYQTRHWIIDEHTGPHFDAPPHFIPPPDSGRLWAGELGNQSGDRAPLEELCGPAACLDMSFLADAEQTGGISPWITVEHIASWEQEHGEITPGSAVLLRTGWDRFYLRGQEGQRYASGALVFQSTPGWPAPPGDIESRAGAETSGRTVTRRALKTVRSSASTKLGACGPASLRASAEAPSSTVVIQQINCCMA